MGMISMLQKNLEKQVIHIGRADGDDKYATKKPCKAGNSPWRS